MQLKFYKFEYYFKIFHVTDLKILKALNLIFIFYVLKNFSLTPF